jgi:uncharacterized membrane protein YdfJ with MMPL/SSD domain
LYLESDANTNGLKQGVEKMAKKTDKVTVYDAKLNTVAHRIKEFSKDNRTVTVVDTDTGKDITYNVPEYIVNYLDKKYENNSALLQYYYLTVIYGNVVSHYDVYSEQEFRYNFKKKILKSI